MGLVVDASVALAHAFADETSPYADRVMREAAQQGLVQPTIWLYEIRNVLIMGVRRNRLRPQRFDEALFEFKHLVVDLDFEHDDATTLSYAREYTLSFYDAAYLEVAYRRRIPLATLDKKLRTACHSLGVDTLG